MLSLLGLGISKSTRKTNNFVFLCLYLLFIPSEDSTDDKKNDCGRSLCALMLMLEFVLMLVLMPIKKQLIKVCVIHTGLNLELNVEQEEYIGLLSPEAGIKMDISTQGEMPFPMERGVSLAPGYATMIGLRKVGDACAHCEDHLINCAIETFIFNYYCIKRLLTAASLQSSHWEFRCPFFMTFPYNVLLTMYVSCCY